MTLTPAYPHDAIAEIAPDIFMVRGSLKMNPVMRISRNMAIVRHEGHLTLVNPIRLNSEGEARLNDLGKVRHIFRLGCFHGIDEPYYMDRYNPEFWCQAGGTIYPEPKIDHELTETTELPLPDAQLFCFRRTLQPESALLLSSGKGLLLTCDAIQHYGDYSNNNWFARMMMPLIGFPRTTVLGPFWMKLVTKENDSLKDEFDRLLEWQFDTLLSAHGTLLETGAHAAVTAAVERAYKNNVSPEATG